MTKSPTATTARPHTTAHPGASRPKLRGALLRGVSVASLVVSGALVAPVQAQAGGISLAGALAQSRSAAAAQASAAALNAQVQAAKTASLGAANVAAAASRFMSLNAALAQAAAAGSRAAVPDGLTAGGLQTADGAGDPTTGEWVGAGLPSQVQANGRSNVTVKQTQALARLTWKSFNVGAKTTLNFDQSAGGTNASSWVALNTVLDPSANPAQILGQINAVGKVFILDANGIAFGAGSSVNVGGLVASTGVIAQSQFNKDINGTITSLNLFGAQSTANTATFVPSFIGATADVTVDAGASIQTATPTGSASGGYVMLLGKNVTNNGAIVTPKGQTILSAGDDFVLRAGFSSSNLTATTNGITIASDGSGVVSNSGAITAQQGDITMAGETIAQNGALLATTTVNTRGSIHLLTSTSDTAASITIGTAAVMTVLPEDDGSTATDSQRSTNISNSSSYNQLRANSTVDGTNPQLATYNTLPDQVGNSRIEVSSGGYVDVKGGALLVATGGQIAIGSGSRTLIESKSTLDVSGSNAATLAVDASQINISGNLPTQLFVNVQPYQLRDSPANRQGGLKSSNVYIDIADLVQIASGAYAGNIYTKGGLIEAGGYLNQQTHGINEWTAVGGTVTLQSTVTQNLNGVISTSGGEVITQAGSTINLTGGSISYEGGLVKQSYVQAADGRIYPIDQAPGNLYYTGLYDGVVESQPRWGISQTYSNPLLTPSEVYQPGFVVGRDAGRLVVTGQTVLLDGDTPAGVTVGQLQTGARPGSVSDPFQLASNVAPRGGALDIGNYSGGVLIGAFLGNATIGTASLDASGITATSVLPDSYNDTIALPSDQISQSGFGELVLAVRGGVTTGGTINVDSALTLGDGGTVTLGGASILVNDGITARGGNITLTNVITANGAPVQLVPTGGSIALSSGTTLDARGEWTNLITDPQKPGSAAYANGGTVTLTSIDGMALAAGSAIDVSSGGVLSASGSLGGATGGSVLISTNTVPGSGLVDSTPVTLDAAIRGYGVTQGGTLSITGESVVLGGAAARASQIAYDPAQMALGFGSYVFNGLNGLSVAAGSNIAPVMPVYALTNGGVRSGANPSDALSVVLPSLYAATRGSDVVTQRRGASISLNSTVDATRPSGGGGSLSVGQGAHITVDPLQSIALGAYGQITMAGTLTAPGGNISVVNTRYEQPSNDPGNKVQSNYLPGLSVWIADGALIDASGDVVVDTDAQGRRFGTLHNGGAIVLGGSAANSTVAQVIVRDGATLRSNGASATFDVLPGQVSGGTVLPVAATTLVGSNGGSISARSYNGIALDGSMQARAGALGASGGSLSMRIDPLNVDAYVVSGTALYGSREIIVSNSKVAVQGDAGLQPGQVTPDDTVGLSRISQSQINDGGFASLALSAQNAVLFDGSVSLHTARSITLSTAIIGQTGGLANTNADQVQISAPYVKLNGFTGDVGTAPQGAQALGAGTLSVTADLIDLANSLYFGGTKLIGSPVNSDGSTAAAINSTSTGFAQVDLTSTGDIRLLGGAPGLNLIDARGNLTMTAAQVYPTTGVTAVVHAGDNQYAPAGGNEYAGGTITIARNSATPALPYSIGGTLALVAEQVFQNGVVRAPEGQIRLGVQPGDVLSPRTGQSTVIAFGANSVTSVSMNGLIAPYGGTVDGVNYTYNGSTVQAFAPVIEADGESITVPKGALIDISGGGTLAGAGFVYGRGGSADVLKTPLLTSSSGTVATAPSTNSVYAILPGYSSAYAPTQPDDSAYSAVGIGAQITIGNDVPGLPAGTYTLLPARYALLPGAYRIELNPTASVNPLRGYDAGNFSTIAPVYLGVANTAIRSPLATAAIITAGANVRLLSQYNEQNYSSFVVANAATNSTPRTILPQDAKTLRLVYPSIVGTATALSFDASALVSAADDSGATGRGYGATLEIAGLTDIAITGAGDAPVAGAVNIDAATLDALDLPRLVLGGTLSASVASAGLYNLLASANSVTVTPDAVLRAGDIMITTTFNNPDASGGSITIAGGATLSTLDASGKPITGAFDINDGFSFTTAYQNSRAAPVLDLSSGRNVFVANPFTSNNAVLQVGDGASLLSSGSLEIFAPLSTSVLIGKAQVGARYVALAASAINIGTDAALAALANSLPSGIALTQSTLDLLLGGSQGGAIPGAQELALTATEAVNLIGSVALNTGTTDLVLNAPAIYGYGAASDSDSITARNFTWSGVAGTSVNSNSNTLAISSAPGAQIAGSASHVIGNLSINAGTITLGYGTAAQPNNQLTLDRLASGFATVALNATAEITANNKSALAVYQTVPTYGSAGVGGTLVLDTPILSAGSGAVLGLTAGDQVLAQGTPGKTASIASLGGEIDVTAGSITLDTAVALASGRLSLLADQAITLGAAAAIDLAGRSVSIFDQTSYSRGGTLSAESRAGSITLASGAVVDVSATQAAAGLVSLSALAGKVDDAASIKAGASAGSTAGRVSIAAGTLASGGSGNAFDAINALLDAGDVYGARSFELGQGDIVVDTGLRAGTLSLAADSGAVIVNATLDAHGSGPGDIALSGSNGVTLGSGALLDAHATSLATDSYGNPIAAENRAHVTLTTASGTILLAGGTRIDVSAPGSTNYGEVILNAPRVGGNAIAVAAPNPVQITGAADLRVYGFTSYSVGQDGLFVQNQNSGVKGLTLASIDADATKFMTALSTNTAFLTNIAGLKTVGAALHLAPGAIVNSTTASGGDITITGDLDFSRLRYSAPSGYGLAEQTGVLGSGEAGSIIFRASNILTINGSISDGFAPPADSVVANYTAADAGWRLVSGSVSPLNTDIVLPQGVFAYVGKSTTPVTDLVLSGANGTGATTFQTTLFDTSRPVALNYDITVAAAAVSAGTTLGFSAALAFDVTIPAGGFIATAPITQNGQVLFAAGSRIPGGTVLPAGAMLGAGSQLPVGFTVADGTLVPAGTLLNTFADAQIALWNDLSVFANMFLPSNTVTVFATSSGKLVKQVYTRPNNTDSAGNTWQGRLYPVAQMLPAGSQSWDMAYVSGANANAADPLAVLPRSVLAGSAAAAAAGVAPGTSPSAIAGSTVLYDEHYLVVSANASNASAAFSVIRTGTGNLNMVAGGNFDQSSLYGIYTAGTQTSTGDATLDASFDLNRFPTGPKGALVRGDTALANLTKISYQAWYPDQGGDVSLLVQGDATGDLYGVGGNDLPSDIVGGWLWRQGGADLGVNTAWWINFGSFTNGYGSSGLSLGLTKPVMTGFQGIGALGGGNVTVSIGGDAGQITNRQGSNTNNVSRGEGLIIAVGSTGRVYNGTTLTTGGGRITYTVGGTINPLDQAGYGLAGAAYSGLNGDVIDLRGQVNVTAGALGRIDLQYLTGTTNYNDPRVADPYTANNGIPAGGFIVVPGDSQVDIYTDRDLVLGGAGDAGRLPEQSLVGLPRSIVGSNPNTGLNTGFSLWTSQTSISLQSAGGNLAPTAQPNANTQVPTAQGLSNDIATDYRFLYPSTLLATAQSGDIIYGVIGGSPAINARTPLELAPSANGEASFVAAQSIFANGYSIDISGADPALTTSPAQVAYTTTSGSFRGLTNLLPYTGQSAITGVLQLFSLEADTPTSDVHANDTTPARFYAGSGDIVNFQTGERWSFGANANEPLPIWYLAAKPVWVIAGRDIVSSGTRPSVYPDSDATFAAQQNQAELPQLSGSANGVTTSGNVFYNGSDGTSVVQAGRDILSSFFYVGGGGLLQVDAGRNITQTAETVAGVQLLAYGAIKSLGSLIAGDRISLTGGADISVLAGIGNGIDYGGFASLYLDPNNAANLDLQLSDSANTGRVQQSYGAAQSVTYTDATGASVSAYTSPLFTYAVQHGYAGGTLVTDSSGATVAVAASKDTVTGAYAFFQTLPALVQQVYLRQVLFDETVASGRQFTDSSSRFYRSYGRGRFAIDALFLPLDELTTWLAANHGYAGDASGAQAAFNALPGADQRAFLDLLYREDFAGAKLLADAAGAYTRSPGVPDGYSGVITMVSGYSGVPQINTNAGVPAVFDAGVQTLFGGNIDVLNPGGQLELGVAGGPAPGGGSGIITFGSGNVDIFTKDSVVLGQSRIFTTGGGNIAIWSAEGDINAGIGAATSVVYNPPVLNYDNLGDLTLIPTAPTNGAGIATLAPLPSVPPGNVDLVAPLGTIDAGEAGIRVSGNLVLAATTIANAANISVGGKSAGVPAAASVNVGAAAAASASAGASTSAAQSATRQAPEKQKEASIIEVEVVSVGGSFEEDQRKRKKGV